MSGLTVHLIPHTHWDREWYLPRAAFVARLVPALDDLLDRLDASPEFRSFFLDGQTVLLEDYLRVRPEQRARVAALVRAGRLQVGPWYVLADELVPSGESLVRNLLLGRADAESLGVRSAVMYSPDAFGHPAVWPALAAEFGISHGVLWRGLGGEPGQEGDLFRWYAPDGRSILLYHLPPDGYEAGSGGLAAGAPAPEHPVADTELRCQRRPHRRVSERMGRGTADRTPRDSASARPNRRLRTRDSPDGTSSSARTYQGPTCSRPARTSAATRSRCSGRTRR